MFRVLAVADGSAVGDCFGDLDAFAQLCGVGSLPKRPNQLDHDSPFSAACNALRMSFALSSDVNADDLSRSYALA